jgi:hypothetical protein
VRNVIFGSLPISCNFLGCGKYMENCIDPIAFDGFAYKENFYSNPPEILQSSKFFSVIEN